MDSVDRFGLEATFSFTVAPSTSKSIKGVLSDLDALQNAIKGFSSGKGGGHIPDPFAPHKGGGAKQQINDLRGIKSEFRALRAESRNIDFGDLNDPNTFNQAKKGLQSYIKELETLKSTIKGNSAAEREFKAQLESQQSVAGNKIDIAGNQRTAAQSQQKMGIAGTVAATGVAALLPLVSIGKDAINTVTEFDYQISQARAVSGASVEESLMIRNKAKALGAATKFSASEAAGAFVSLGQAGYKADQQMKAIDGTLMLAASGAVDLGTATDITVSVLGGFQAGADKASHYANVLAQTANAANLGVGDLGETMKYAAPSAKAFGASVEQTAAFTGILSNAGIKGSSAGTALRTMFLRLSDPVKKAAMQLKQYRIATTNADGSFREMPDILADVNKALSGATDEKKTAFFTRVFGTEASGAVQVLANNLQGVADLTQQNLISSKAFGGMGVAAYQAGIMEDNIKGAFDSLSSALEGVQIEIADVLKVAVIPVIKKITELASAFINLPQPIKTAIVVTGGIVAGLASLATIAGSVAFGFYALQGAMATASIGMTTMATSGIPLTGFFGTVMSAFASQGIVGAFTAFGSVLTGTVATALGALVSPFAIVTGALIGLYSVLEYITPGVNILGTALSAIAAPIGFVTGLVKGFATTLFSGLGERLGGLGDSLGGLSPILGFLGNTVKMVSDTFSKFFGVGESSGEGFANSILLMVDIVSGAFKVLWGAIDLFLIKPINLARDTWGATFTTIGQIVGFGVETINTAISPLLNIPSFFQGISNGVKNIVSFIPQIISDPFGTGITLIQAALTSFTALPEYFQGIITQIQNIVSAVTGFIAAPFQSATSTINTLWDNTGSKIAGVFNMLTGKSAETGYDLVGNLAEHSPGTTWQIRQKWGMTTESIAGGLDKLVEFGEDTGNTLSESMSLPKLGEVAMPTMGAMGAIALPAIANAIPLEVQPVIDQTGIIDQISSELNTGLAQIPVDGMLRSFSQLAPVEFLVDKLSLGFSAIDTSLKSATGSSVFFGVAGIASISPLLIGVGAMGLAIAAVSLNFLGLRDIIVGVGKSIWSILDAAKNVALGLVQIFQGVVRFVQSIPAAITGDFSGMAQSLRGIWQGLSTIVESFANGVVGVFNGLSQSVRGIFTGLGQVIDGVFLGGWYRSISESVNNSLQLIRHFGQNISTFISGVAGNVGLSFSEMFSGILIVESLNFIRASIQIFGNGITSFVNNLESGIRNSFVQMFEGSAIAAGLSSIKTTIQSFGDGVSGFINSLESNIKNSLAQMFSGNFLGGLVSQLNGGIGVIQQFVERGVLSFHGLIQGIQGSLNRFGQIFQGAFLGGWVNSLSEVLGSAKSAIVNFISSITSALNKPIEAVGNTANKIKGMLGFKQKQESIPSISTPQEITPVVNQVEMPKLPTIASPAIGAIEPPKISPVINPIEIPKVASISPVVNPIIGSLDMPKIPEIAVPQSELPTLTQQIQQRAIPEISSSIPVLTQPVQRQMLPEMPQISPVVSPVEMPKMPSVSPVVSQTTASPELPKIPDIPETKVGKLAGSEQLESQIHAVKIGSVQMADTVGNSVQGVGQMLSIFVPQLADPVMAIGNFISTGAGLGQSLSQLKEGAGQFLGNLSGLSPMLLSARDSAIKTGTALIATLMPSFISLGTTVSGFGMSMLGLIPGFNGFIASASAAGVASGGFMATLTPILVGLLPFAAVVGAVVGSLALLKAAFDNNFLGLKDGVNTVVTPITNAFNWIGAQSKNLGGAIYAGIGQGLQKLEGLIKVFFSPIVELVTVVVQQFQGMFAPISRVMSQFAEPLRAIGQMVFNLLIMPLKVLGTVAIAPLAGVFFALKGITEVLKPVIKIVGFLGSLVVESLLLPFKAVLEVIKSVEMVGDIIGNAFNGIRDYPSMIMGVVGQIGNLMSGVVNLITSPFRLAADAVGMMWHNTGGKIGQMFGWLTGQASTTGSQLVSNLAENSPGPTWQIRQKWGQTTEAIADGLGYLTGKGELAGHSLSESMVLPEIKTDFALPDFSAMGAAVQGFVGSLGENPLSGMLTAIDGSFQNITNQVKSATGGMIGFAIASLTGLAPLILTLAGVGLAIGAVTVNFLGLRDMVMGVGKSVWSILQAAIGVVTGVIQVFRGLIGFVRSIPAAITGDFSGMAQSLRGIWQGIGTIVASTFNGIVGVVNGVIQSIQGIFVGFSQVFRGTALGGWFSSINEFLGKARTTITDFANTVTGMLNKPFEVVSNTADKVKGVFGMGKKTPIPTPEMMTVMPEVGLNVVPQVNPLAGIRTTEIASEKVSAIAMPEISGVAAASDTLGQFGSLVGAIAPQFAAPIMAVSSFASTASSLVPTLITMFPALGGLIPVITGLGTSMMSLIPGLGGVTIASGGLMATLAPLLAVLLPFVAVAGAVAGAFFLLKTAFDNNFLGLADAVNFVISPFVQGFEFIKNAVGSAINFIGGKLTEGSNFFRATVGAFLQPIFNLVGAIGKSIGDGLSPVFEVLKMLAPILGAIGQGLMNTLVMPFKIAGGMISGVFQGIAVVLSPLIQSVGKVIGSVINSIMIPVKFAIGSIGLIQSGISALSGSIISPVQMLQSALSGVVGFFSQIPNLLGGLFTNLWSLIPAPIRWLVENAMGGAGAIGGGVINKETPTIPQFATGGLMQNEGLAYLHPNEFIVNPQATEGNIGALSQLNSTGTLPTAMMATPIPVPTAPPQAIAQSANQKSSPANVTVSLSFGDVIIQNATDGVQAAKEFFESVKPQFDRAVRDSLREMTELAK